MKINVAMARSNSSPFTIEEVELDEPRYDEVIVKIAGVGLCHTDLAMKEAFPVFPLVLGHEGSGVVEKVGSQVTRVKPGDKVTISYRSCGKCRQCLEGVPYYCANFSQYNSTGTRPDGSFTIKNDDGPVFANFLGQSSFGTYSLTNESQIVKVPDDIPLELLGPLGCGIQTGAGAVINSLGVRAGSSIAIFGTGSVGLSAVMAAAVSGCTKIIAVDVNDERLKKSQELGATHVVNSKKHNPVSVIHDICGGAGSDFALDTSANPGVMRQALESVYKNGTCGWLGVYSGDIAIDYISILNGRKIIGIMAGSSICDVFIPSLIELYQAGKLPFDKFIRKYKLSDINEAVADSHSGSTIKAVLIP